MVDAADEVAFEAADRFAFGLAVGALFGEVDGGAGVVADPDDREHVEGAVEPAVAAGVEAVAVGASGWRRGSGRSRRGGRVGRLW